MGSKTGGQASLSFLYLSRFVLGCCNGFTVLGKVMEFSMCVFQKRSECEKNPVLKGRWCDDAKLERSWYDVGTKSAHNLAVKPSMKIHHRGS